jgi:uncharacterized membrane protein YheB (UPF0754 family)
MNWWLLILPLVAAFLGWCFVYLALQLLFHPLHPRKIAGISFQGLIPKKQLEIAKKTGALAASILPVKEIAEKITHPDNVKKIMPQAEEHIEYFLRVKLVKSMPVVGMFVGDKTINSLKSLFMTELEELFPVIMKNYMGRLEEDFDIEKIVAGKLSALPPRQVEKLFLETTRKERQMAGWMGALMGFVIGVIQLLIIQLATT